MQAVVASLGGGATGERAGQVGFERPAPALRHGQSNTCTRNAASGLAAFADGAQVVVDKACINEDRTQKLRTCTRLASVWKGPRQRSGPFDGRCHSPVTNQLPLCVTANGGRASNAKLFSRN